MMFCVHFIVYNRGQLSTSIPVITSKLTGLISPIMSKNNQLFDWNATEK